MLQATERAVGGADAIGCSRAAADRKVDVLAGINSRSLTQGNGASTHSDKVLS